MPKVVKTKTCHKCKGSGLIVTEPYICNNCHTLNIQNCMYCENINKSLFGECYICHGSGRENIKKITNNNICHD